MSKKLDLETLKVDNFAYKYLCPACTNEAMHSSEPKKIKGDIFCPICQLTKPFDESRWVKVE